MRRYDLDWLRVIVFSLLIFYHVGMFFVPWEWHLKNSVIYPGLRWPMLFINQWRLPILFIISGMGTYFALGKRNGKQFASERITRLLIPLLAGIIFIVPPQVYLERLKQGLVNGNYLHFWTSQAFDGIYPEGNFSWHHLWFLPYLLFFSLLLVPVFLYLKKNRENNLIRKMEKIASKRFGLFWLAIPLFLWESLLEPFFPSTHAFYGDWFNMVNYMNLFFYGFLLISIKDIFWKTVSENRRRYLYLGLASFAVLTGIWHLDDNIYIHFIEAAVKAVNMWAWILVLFGYAAIYLNKESRVLSYANEAVYPFYILHQTVTIIIGFLLMDLSIGLIPKFAIMAAGTFFFTWIIYEFGIRRWSFIRPLFGLKQGLHNVKRWNAFKRNTRAYPDRFEKI